MKRLMFSIIVLIFILPKLAAATPVGGPFEIVVDLVTSTGNDISVLDLSNIDVSIDKGGATILTNYINDTGMLFTDFHFDVGPLPGAILGDMIWDDLNGTEFSSNSFFDIFFEIALDEHLVVDMYKNNGSGIAPGSSFQISLTNNTTEDLATSSYPTVPEPTTLALMSLGIAGLGYRKRKAA